MLNADYFAVFDAETNNLVVEFDSIDKLRAFFKKEMQRGINVIDTYYVDASKMYSGALLWVLISNPIKEY